MKKNYAIIAAAGSGSRMQLNFNKLFIEFDGKSILEHTVEKFASHPFIDGVLVVHSKEDTEKIKALLSHFGEKVQLVLGGQQRYASVFNALQVLPEDCEIVLIHDAARPFITEEIISGSIFACRDFGNAVVGVPVKDTIKQCTEDAFVTNTPDRNTLWSVQTPQTFYYKEILSAYKSCDLQGVTDDASVLERAGGKVKMIMGSYNNIKITTCEDLKQNALQRVGIGYDVHAFAQERRLILGGVEIPYSQGLLGHSDADVLVHAIMDALLGAAALGDIGKHFPDTDMVYKGISSLDLLAKVCNLLKSEKYVIINISAVVLAQAPKLAQYIEEMRRNIANVLGISLSCINIAATTTEKLGFIGRQEGMAAEAIALLSFKGE